MGAPEGIELESGRLQGTAEWTAMSFFLACRKPPKQKMKVPPEGRGALPSLDV
jgi:hypothetical protein